MSTFLSFPFAFPFAPSNPDIGGRLERYLISTEIYCCSCILSHSSIWNIAYLSLFCLPFWHSLQSDAVGKAFALSDTQMFVNIDAEYIRSDNTICSRRIQLVLR